jgi:Flp pilus assembly protein TadD
MAPKEGPPTLAECAQWLVFTKFNAFEAAKSMAARMAEPPFTPEQGRQARGEMERRLAELTPAVIQQVLEQYRSVLPGRTNDLLLCANYANVLYVTGDNAGAVARYRELLGRYPYASDWQYFLGDSLAAEGKAEEAEKWLRRSLEQDPSNAEAQAALGAVRSNAGRASQPR